MKKKSYFTFQCFFFFACVLSLAWPSTSSYSESLVVIHWFEIVVVCVCPGGVRGERDGVHC